MRVCPSVSLPFPVCSRPTRIRQLSMGPSGHWRYEAILYITLAVIGATTRPRYLRWACLILLTLFALGWCVSKALGVDTYTIGLPFITINFDWMYLAVFSTFFFAGSSLYVFRHSVRLLDIGRLGTRPPLHVRFKSLVGNVVSVALPSVCDPCFRISSACDPPPVRQTGRSLLRNLTSTRSLCNRWLLTMQSRLSRLVSVFAVSSIATVILAGLSWHYVERPALGWKVRLINSQRFESVEHAKGESVRADRASLQRSPDTFLT